jgi:hypothetical protein
MAGQKLGGPLGAKDAGSLMQPLPLSRTGQRVPGFPNGAPAALPQALSLTDAEIAGLKAGKYRAGIAMQALDTPGMPSRSRRSLRRCANTESRSLRHGRRPGLGTAGYLASVIAASAGVATL